MASIGISKASYFADLSVSRFSKSIDQSTQKISSAQSNSTNGNQSSRVTMTDTFKLDIAGKSAAIKSMSVTQSYLATSVSVLDNASDMLSRMYELAVLGANSSNTAADNVAIDAETERLSDRFHALMSMSQYKGKRIFHDTPHSLSMAVGGEGAEIKFGAGAVDYDAVYDYTNPGVNTTEPATKYEIKKNLTTEEKDAILAQTTGLTREDLVVGFQFTTNEQIAQAGPGIKTNDLYYLDGDGTVAFDPVGTVVSDENFNGGSLEFKFTANGETSDNFNLVSGDGTAGTVLVNAGKISYVDAVEGSIEIGEISSDGQDGSSLKIDFYEDASIPGTSNLQNGDFSNGFDNWTVHNNRVDFGNQVDGRKIIIDGREIPTPSDADMQQFNMVNIDHPSNTLRGRSPNPDDNADAPPLNLQASTANGYLNLDTGNFSFTNEGGAVLHGPAAVSDPFLATEGDFLKLDYKADGSGDWYHVVGYLVDEFDNITYALREYGKTTDGWISASVEVPTTSPNYRFVFINGTWDWSQGRAAGADFNIDNIRAERPYEITNDVIQDVLRAITYSSSSNNQASVKDVLITLTDKNGVETLTDTSKIFNSEFNGKIMLAPTKDLENAVSLGGSQRSNLVTYNIEVAQERINTARVYAASQYAAIEAAINSITDLRAQFFEAAGELSDINFSLEAAHLAKKKMMENAAAAVLAQANKTQNGLLDLV